MLAIAGPNLARKPGRMLVLSARTMRELGTATRNPILAAAGNQLRDQLRGPLGTLLNIGRKRPEERDEMPERGSAAAVGAADAVQPGDHAAPRVRVPVGHARIGQGNEDQRSARRSTTS